MNALFADVAVQAAERSGSTIDEAVVLANLFVIGLACFFGLVIGLLAIRKHRSFWLWGVFGAATFLIAGIALAFVSILCPKCKEPLTNKQWNDRLCPHCGDLRT